MKSPWKYLVGLASRGMQAKEPEGLREIGASKPDELLSALTRESWTPVSGMVSPPPEAPPETVDTSDIPTDTAAAPTHEGDPASALPVDQPTTDDQLPSHEQLRKNRITKPQRRLRATVKTAWDADINEPINESIKATARLTFNEEIIALDEEVRELRGQLAERLRLQNEQLKLLLERFRAR